jgi:hypothetical protein
MQDPTASSGARRVVEALEVTLPLDDDMRRTLLLGSGVDFQPEADEPTVQEVIAELQANTIRS